MDKKILRLCIIASIKNDEEISKRNPKSRNKAYKLKYFLWNIALSIFSPYIKTNSKIFVLAMNMISEKRYVDMKIEGDIFRFARQNDNIKKIKSNQSVVSKYPLYYRAILFIKALMFYYSNIKDLWGYLPNTIEYFHIANYIYENGINTIIFPGIYDRYCTFISYLGNAMGIKLVGIQDGAAINISIPQKIYCDEMYCFDKYEEKIFRKYFKNSNCIYHYIGFSSLIKWSEYKGNKKGIIVVASQDWFTEKTKQVLEVVLTSVIKDKFSIILYPHYREKSDAYNDIKKKYPLLTIESDNRYSRADLVITFYSTIVYDFWSLNPDIPILCLRIDGYEPGYYSRPNVHVCSDMEELKSTLEMLMM